MTAPAPFLLPDGLELVLGATSLVVRHPGDVTLAQTLGRRLTRVEAGGDVTLTLSPVQGVVRAGGVVRIEGRVEAEEIRGREIHLGDHPVRCVAIVAQERIVVGAAEIQADILMAPEIVLHPEARGRVRLLDRAPTDAPLPAGLEGCLSLVAFEREHGGAADFLARRGVHRAHGEAPPGAAAPHGPAGALAGGQGSDAIADRDAGEVRRPRRGLLRGPSTTNPTGAGVERERTAQPAPPNVPPPRVLSAPRPATPIEAPPPAAPPPAPPFLPPATVSPPAEPQAALPLPPAAETPSPVARAEAPSPLLPLAAELSGVDPTDAPVTSRARSMHIPAAPSTPAPTTRPETFSDDGDGASEAVPMDDLDAFVDVPDAGPAVLRAVPHVEGPDADAVPGLVVRADRSPRPRTDLARHASKVRSLTAQLAQAYAGAELASGTVRPDAVHELLRLVERGRMEALATDLDRLWTEALRAHLAAASPMPWAAIAAFHGLNALRAPSV